MVRKNRNIQFQKFIKSKLIDFFCEMANDFTDNTTKLLTKLDFTFFSYIVCGGIATLFDWSTFYLLNLKLHFNYLIAVSLSFTVGSIINYTLNKYYTFNNKHKNILLQFTVYLTGALSGLCITWILMIFFIKYLYYQPMLSRIIITGIMLFYNYLYHKTITFGKIK